jgi:hypothetical protein
VQAANLAPLLWICVQRQLSRQGSRRAGAAGGAAHGAVGGAALVPAGGAALVPAGPLALVPAVHVTLLVGTAVMVCFALTWDATARIAGAERSTGLLVNTFLAGAADAMTSVLYWPFAARFPAQYTTALAVGEGASALVGSGLALIQQPQWEVPRFGVRGFLLACAGLMAIAWAAFVYLSVSARALRETATAERRGDSLAGRNNSEPKRDPAPEPLGHGSRGSGSVPLLFPAAAAADGRDPHGTTAGDPPLRGAGTIAFAREYTVHLGVIALCALASNGILPAVSTFALLPYHGGGTALLWTGVITSIVEPLAGFAAKFTIAWSARRLGANDEVGADEEVGLCESKGAAGIDGGSSLDIIGEAGGPWPCALAAPRSLLLQAAVWAPLTLAIVVLAARPASADTSSGFVALPAALFVAHRAVTVHARTCAFVGLRARGGARAAQMGGAAVQAGSAAGALGMFALVQYAGVFAQG